MNKDAKILIVGHDDIIENSLWVHFQSQGFTKVFSSSRMALNPTIQPSVYEFFQKERPEYVFLGSTRSGGIEANQKNAAEFIYHNLESQNNIIYSAWKFGAKKLLYFASSCVYPKVCPQPMKEEYLLSASLEKTSEPYSVAKIAGIKLAQAFRQQYGFNAIVAIPATVYGPESDTEMTTSHVMGALIGKFAAAIKEKKEEVTIWGTGQPQREFLYADDFVAASIFLMDHYEGQDIINMGSGADIVIKELAHKIAAIVGFKGKIVFDPSKPDGTMQKLLDNSRLVQLGWKPCVKLDEGIKRTWERIKVL